MNLSQQNIVQLKASSVFSIKEKARDESQESYNYIVSGLLLNSKEWLNIEIAQSLNIEGVLQLHNASIQLVLPVPSEQENTYTVVGPPGNFSYIKNLTKPAPPPIIYIFLEEGYLYKNSKAHATNCIGVLELSQVQQNQEYQLKLPILNKNTNYQYDYNQLNQNYPNNEHTQITNVNLKCNIYQYRLSECFTKKLYVLDERGKFKMKFAIPKRQTYVQSVVKKTSEYKQDDIIEFDDLQVYIEQFGEVFYNIICSVF